MWGALSSQGLPRPASRSWRCWKESLSHHKQAPQLHLQTALPAPAANQILQQSPKLATKTLWWGLISNNRNCKWRNTKLSHHQVFNFLGFLLFSRVMSKLHQTQRLATGKSTSTSFSTLSVQLPWWRKSKLRRRKVTHHPRLQTGWAMDPSHPQRCGLEKCLVRLIGNWKKIHLLDQKIKNKKHCKFLIIDTS